MVKFGGSVHPERTPNPCCQDFTMRCSVSMPVMANAWRSASKRAMTLPRVHAQLDDLERDAAADQFFLLGYIGRKRMISGVVHDAAEFLAKTSPKQQIKYGFEEGLVPARLPLLRRHNPAVRSRPAGSLTAAAIMIT